MKLSFWIFEGSSEANRGMNIWELLDQKSKTYHNIFALVFNGKECKANFFFHIILIHADTPLNSNFTGFYGKVSMCFGKKKKKRFNLASQSFGRSIIIILISLMCT